MGTENGNQVDLAAVEEVLRRVDVLTIGFPLFPERLLVDLRSSTVDGQFAGIVEPVASVQERYLWLGQHRGTFGAPEAFSFFVWPQSVESLGEGSILAPLRDRLTPDAQEALATGFTRAVDLERRAILRAVRGAADWPALWDAHAGREQERGQP